MGAARKGEACKGKATLGLERMKCATITLDSTRPQCFVHSCFMGAVTRSMGRSERELMSNAERATKLLSDACKSIQTAA
eukprot:scaffold24244_cov17-Tisochrysis_lutea.AAC.1